MGSVRAARRAGMYPAASAAAASAAATAAEHARQNRRDGKAGPDSADGDRPDLAQHHADHVSALCRASSLRRRNHCPNQSRRYLEDLHITDRPRGRKKRLSKT
jgi:hypothetical protein